MKRDMDLVRCILLQVEASDSPLDVAALGTDGSNLQEVAYHIDMMQAHGLLDARLRTFDTKDGFRYAGGTVFALTWDGCDYLEAVRNDGVWSKAKSVISETVGSTTLELVKKAALMVAEKAIASHIGV